TVRDLVALVFMPFSRCFCHTCIGINEIKYYFICLAHADHGATIGKPVIASPAQARGHNTSESFKARKVSRQK
ncbi:hypothetical protein EV424DRAFT_1421598, partial [Suillus variegatus]